MLDHVSITVADLARAGTFYDAIFEALGHMCVRRDVDILGYGLRNRPDDDSHTYISIRATGQPVSVDHRHWCFRAPSRRAVDAFHAAGLAAGGRDDGAPGLRPHYHDAYYAAFLIDPDGNRIEAVCHRPEHASDD
ncbi:MAG TPA: VOC family protein [Kiloniellales bacterium]|jgi:catechol 2,3-dioxygenase-like lactoylglutathione lyase family enzyme